MDDRETGLNPRRIAEATAVYRTSEAGPMPPVEVHPSAEQRVKLPQVLAILPSLFATLNRAAADYGIPVSRYRLRVPWSPEEPMELIVDQCVEASKEETKTYWSSFDDLLQDWVDSLPKELARFVDDNMLVSVRRDGDGFLFSSSIIPGPG